MKTLKIVAALFVLAALAFALSPELRAQGTTYIDIINDKLVVGGGTSLSKVVVYTQTLAPAAATTSNTALCAGCTGTFIQAFIVTGLAVTDHVALDIGNSPVTAGCPPVAARANAAHSLTITFAKITAVDCTPAAGIYRILATRT